MSALASTSPARSSAYPPAEIADAILVPAALEGGGVGVFLVETKAKGVSQTPLVTTSRQPESVLVLADAAGDPVGSTDQGAEIVAWIELRATAALCALAVGVCSEALRLTAEYTKTRKQFDQPIATFQAVAQRAADAFIDTEAVRLTALQAAWRIDAGLPAEAAVAAAKVWAAQGGSRVVRAAQHLHGGVGVDREYPAPPLLPLRAPARAHARRRHAAAPSPRSADRERRGVGPTRAATAGRSRAGCHARRSAAHARRRA